MNSPCNLIFNFLGIDEIDVYLILLISKFLGPIFSLCLIQMSVMPLPKGQGLKRGKISPLPSSTFFLFLMFPYGYIYIIYFIFYYFIFHVHVCDYRHKRGRLLNLGFCDAPHC
jgi:hypothetical protein